MSHEVDLRAYGLSVPETLVNAPVAQLYEHGVEFDRSEITSCGALAASSGEKTGRSPLDKRIVKDPASQRDIWWGTINFELFTFKIGFIANSCPGGIKHTAIILVVG